MENRRSPILLVHVLKINRNPISHNLILNLMYYGRVAFMIKGRGLTELIQSKILKNRRSFRVGK